MAEEIEYEALDADVFILIYINNYQIIFFIY